MWSQTLKFFQHGFHDLWGSQPAASGWWFQKVLQSNRRPVHVGRRSLPWHWERVFFFQVDLVGSQDSVDVMAVCWLRISGADVPLPTKSGASNHLRTLLCRTTTCFFLFCFAGFTMFFLYFSWNSKNRMSSLKDEWFNNEWEIAHFWALTHYLGFSGWIYQVMFLWISSMSTQELVLKTADFLLFLTFSHFQCQGQNGRGIVAWRGIWRSWR